MMKNNILGKLLCGTLMLFAAVSFTACVDDNEDVGMPYLELDSETLPFTLEGGDAAFMVKTNRPWFITKDEASDWLTVEPMQGEGATQVKIQMPAATTGREATLTFNIANSYGVYLTKTMKIQQGEIKPAAVLWHENFGDTGQTASPWPLVAEYDASKWEKGGLYGAEVTYTAVSGTMSLRNSGKLSAGYADASGAAKLFFGSGSPAFVAGNIQTDGAVNYTLNFGGAYSKSNNNVYDNTFYTDKFHVYISADNKKWSEVIYTTAQADEFWVYATALFTLTEPADVLYVKLVADIASVFAVDDMQLISGGVGGQEIDLAAGAEGEGGNEGEEPTPDTPTDTTATDINALIGMMGSSTVTLDKDYTIEGVVLSDVTGGNYTGNNLVLQTEGSTTAKNGVVLFGSQVDPVTLGLNRGDKVKVTLLKDKAQLKIYNDLYEITGDKDATWCSVEKIGTGTVAPTVITVSQMKDFQSMLVTIKDVTILDAGTWCTADAAGNHTFTAGGSNLTVYVKKAAAAFADKEFKATTGDMTGIVTMYNGAVQLAPRDLADVATFMEGGTTPDTPDTPTDTALSVKELVQMMIAGTAYTEKTVEGYVAAFAPTGTDNMSQGTLILTDNDGAEYSGLTIYNYALSSLSLKVGDKVKIALTSGTTDNYNGLRQIKNIPADAVTVLSSGATIQYKTLTGAQLVANYEKYLSVPVQVLQAKPTAESVGKNFNTTLTFNDGTDFTVYGRSKWTAGSELTVADKTGTIRGILSTYNNPQLVPASTADVEPFTGTTTPDPTPDPDPEPDPTPDPGTGGEGTWTTQDFSMATATSAYSTAETEIIDGWKGIYVRVGAASTQYTAFTGTPISFQVKNKEPYLVSGTLTGGIQQLKFESQRTSSCPATDVAITISVNNTVIWSGSVAIDKTFTNQAANLIDLTTQTTGWAAGKSIADLKGVTFTLKFAPAKNTSNNSVAIGNIAWMSNN